MAQLQTFPISFPDFPKIQSCTTVTPEQWSVYYCIGFSILKVLIRSKPFGSLHDNFKDMLRKALDYCERTFQTSDAVSNIEAFKAILGYFEGQNDVKQCHAWLDYWLSPQQSLNSILYTSYYIASFLVSGQGVSIDAIIVSEPFKIIQLFSAAFGVHIELIWETDHYRYEVPTHELSFLLFLYYNTQTKIFGVLSQEFDSIIESEWRDQQQFNDQFLFNPSQLANSAVNTQQSFVTIRSDCPQLINLLSIMAQTLTKNELYSKEIEEALKKTIEVFPGLEQIVGLRKLLEVRQPSCVQHQDSKCIRLRCGNEHCSECIFLKIKSEYMKTNTTLFCPCKVQIAPKFIQELKQSEEFKEYFRKV